MPNVPAHPVTRELKKRATAMRGPHLAIAHNAAIFAGVLAFVLNAKLIMNPLYYRQTGDMSGPWNWGLFIAAYWLWPVVFTILLYTLGTVLILRRCIRSGEACTKCLCGYRLTGLPPVDGQVKCPECAACSPICDHCFKKER
jgi:hypothetical protein